MDSPLTFKQIYGQLAKYLTCDICLRSGGRSFLISKIFFFICLKHGCISGDSDTADPEFFRFLAIDSYVFLSLRSENLMMIPAFS